MLYGATKKPCTDSITMLSLSTKSKEPLFPLLSTIPCKDTFSAQ